MDDWELLQAFARQGSEAAFRQIVERHIHHVHSMALRQTGEAHQAADVTQAVFLILLRKAGSLGRHTVLSGWLFNATRHVARAAQRAEQRRREREREVMEAMQHARMDTASPAATLAAGQLDAHLDNAMASLREADRNAILLRYFQQQTVEEVAASLGTSAEAAQKRIERAVEKLRRYFGRRGVAVPALALAGAVSAHAVQPAPPLLVQGVTALAAPSAPAVSAAAAGLMHGALGKMLLSKVALLGAAALFVLAPLGVFLATNRAATQGFDLSGDFSMEANPGVAWSYGWKGALDDTFTPLTVRHISLADGAERIPSWQLTSGQAPAIYKNTTMSAVGVGRGAGVIPAGAIWALPGEDGRPENYGTIRLVIPKGRGGTYRLETTAQPHYRGPPQGDTDFHVMLNDRTLFGRSLDPAESTGYTNTLQLAEGDRIDLMVGRGRDGRQFGSVLMLEARLRPVKSPALAGLR